MAIDYRERQYISQYANDLLGFSIMKAGVPTNADGNVTLTLTLESGPTAIFTDRVATNPSTGLYEVALVPGDAATPGNYTLSWTYTLDAVAETYVTYAVIGSANPAYDNLTPALKDLVDSVWIRFADLFDHPSGGPHMQTYFQVNFDRGRIAQLMNIAVGRLNTMAQPYQTYTVRDGGASFPIDQWGPLLETMTYIECLKHLIRGYVEQPQFIGSGAVSRLDRRDYMQRWEDVLNTEESMLKGQLDTFKIANMGFGKPKVLVSGGVYGRYGPTRVAGSIAARPRYWTRWY